MIERLKKNYYRNKTIYFCYMAAIVMYVAAMIIVPGFGVGTHVRSLMLEASLIGIMALGQTFVIISGGADLSMPWTMTGSAVLLTSLSNQKDDNIIWIILLILALCTIVGMLNGLGVAYLKIPPMIMTLGMNSILQGALLVVLRGSTGGLAPQSIINLATGSLLGIPNLFIFWITLGFAASVLLHYSTYGHKLFALGNNEKAAYFTGIRVKRVKMMAYVISSLAPAITGILYAGRLGQSYLGMGDSFLFLTIIAVVLGGASPMGGSGSSIGTFAGTCILIVLKSFLASANLPTSAQDILNGIVLIVAIILMSGKNRKRDRL
ncbi:MAG: ABC transporter permease [Eubacteriales bacterium]|nr:ABC transporter permease [Eubacteriales bacterium]